MKIVQILSYFWSVISGIRTEYGGILRISPYVFSPNVGKYGPEITLYLDTIRTVSDVKFSQSLLNKIMFEA